MCLSCENRLKLFNQRPCNDCVVSGGENNNFTPLKDVAPSVNEKPVNDNVNHPSHYATGKYECIDVMLEIFGVEAVKTFCLLNALSITTALATRMAWRIFKKPSGTLTNT